MGRSDLFLKLEIIKKCYGLAALVIAVFCFDSPIAIALTGVFTTFISCFVNAFPNRKLTGYSYIEQMRDLLPPLVASLVMFGCVLAINWLSLPTLLTLVVQIVLGIAIYIGISAVTKMTPFVQLLQMVRALRRR